jgi:hypothetical protein
VSGALELIAVALAVGVALAYVVLKSLRAAKSLAKGQAPSCCTDKDGYALRAGRSACPDLDGAAPGGGNSADADGMASAGVGSAGGGPSAAPGGFVSPCAGCTGCSQGRG